MVQRAQHDCSSAGSGSEQQPSYRSLGLPAGAAVAAAAAAEAGTEAAAADEEASADDAEASDLASGRYSPRTRMLSRPHGAFHERMHVKRRRTCERSACIVRCCVALRRYLKRSGFLSL